MVQRYCLTMGAIAGIRIYGGDRRFCDRAAEAAFREMRRTDRLMSSFDRGSALSRINRAAGREEAAAPEEIVAILESARAYHAATGGAFDVTVGPLTELYGFTGRGICRRATDGPDGSSGGSRAGAFPDDRTIAAALGAVGFGKISINRTRMTVGLINPRSRIDLGGIGVGYALDRAAAALRGMGVESALINHSGDLLAIGAPPGAAGWEIGIQDPEDPRGTIATFTLRDRSVSTSGNYENFIETRCGKIGHILDPVTGRSPSRFLGVSVMAGTSLAADALSTGFFTGGPVLAAGLPPGAGTVSAYTVRRDGDPSRGGRIASEYIGAVGHGPPPRKR